MTPYAEKFTRKAGQLFGSGLVDEAADMLRDVVRDEPAAVPAWHLLFTIARTQDRMQQLVDSHAPWCRRSRTRKRRSWCWRSTFDRPARTAGILHFSPHDTSTPRDSTLN